MQELDVLGQREADYEAWERSVRDQLEAWIIEVPEGQHLHRATILVELIWQAYRQHAPSRSRARSRGR